MKKKFIFIMAIALLSSYSCQKALLSPPLPTTVSNQNYAPFSTSARITAQVLGLYSALKSGQFLGGRYQIYGDVKADNWINSTANSVTAYQTWTESVSSTSSEVINLWTQCYLVINDCNLFIDGMAAAGTAVVGATVSANYVAEAKFIRAVCYYALLQMYCQPEVVSSGTSLAVPLRLTGLSAYGNYNLAASTVATIYAQVVSDLKAAEAGLPLTYADAPTNTTRAHRNTAIAYLTRVYLSMQDYADCMTEAAKIVPQTTAPFSATTGVANALQASVKTVFTTYTTTESILSMPFINPTEVPGSQNALADYFNSVATSEFYLNPAGVIADPLWKSTDARRGFISTVVSATLGTRMYLTKWTQGSSTGFADWVPVIRYPEVLLSYAEAVARTSSSIANATLAINLLNAVRGRSDPSTVYTAASFPNGTTDLIAAIMEERNIEFLGEGLRWPDLLRVDATIPAKSVVAAVPPTSVNYIWPIPNTEELNNPLIGR